MTREVRRIAYRVTRSAVAFGLTLLMVPSSTPQSAPVDQHAELMRDKVVSIGQGRKTTVEMLDGRKYHGKIASIDAEIFKLDEVDLQQKETLHYKEVKHVKAGYMQKSLFTGRRRDPMPLWLQTAIVSGAVLGVFGIALLLHQS